MPTYRGLSDIYLNPTADSVNNNEGVASRAAGELFTTIVNHLSSSGPALGIEMIAANFGVDGNGLGYWDTATRAGHRAFACFRFHSASLGKFDCLLYVVTGSAISVSPMNVGGTTTTASGGGNSRICTGISFAWHPSGSNTTQSDGPWNGTYSLTSASIGSPVWKLNSAQKGGFWPRANGILGANSGSRNYMFSCFLHSIYTNNVQPSRNNLLISEDSFTLFREDQTFDSSYKIMHFGSFTPRNGLACDSPYFGWHSNEGQMPFGAFYTTTLGATSADATTIYDGCVSLPTLLSGARNMAFIVPGIDQNIGFNRYIESGSVVGGAWEQFPVWVAAAETPSNYGMLGLANHIAYGYGMTNMSLTDVSSSLALGTNTINQAKLILPWSGSAPGTSTPGRLGNAISFSR